MPLPARNAAWYAAPVARFLATPKASIRGELSAARGYTLVTDQVAAWEVEIELLRSALDGVDGWLHLEFDIPRLGRRVDAVLVSGGCVVAIEFKVGATTYERADWEQAWDYGLDLKNFHRASHHAPIFPVLCATRAAKADAAWRKPHPDAVRPPFRTHADGLARSIRLALAAAADAPPVDAQAWGTAPTAPPRPSSKPPAPCTGATPSTRSRAATPAPGTSPRRRAASRPSSPMPGSGVGRRSCS